VNPEKYDDKKLLDNIDPSVKQRMFTINSKELIYWTLVKDTTDDGQGICAQVIVEMEDILKN
jgi:hypothetical protein